MRPGLGLALLAALSAMSSGAAAGNALLNPGFESGAGMPDAWATFGTGTFEWLAGDAHTGSRSMRLGNAGLAGMYQRVSGARGREYRVQTWARGTGSGAVKLEFHDAAVQRIAEVSVALDITGVWNEYAASGLAPAGTTLVTATIVGNPGGTLQFDDLTLETVQAPGRVTFDLERQRQTFLGFGTQIWGYHANAALLARALGELSIRYVRIENHDETSTWAQVQATRAVTDGFGIEWVYMVWSAPGRFRTGGVLNDPAGFAVWWADHVDEAYANGVPVEYVELMNEPDSNGQWSTGIYPADMSTLIAATRAALDARGHHEVDILAPGLAAMSWSNPDEYINALDDSALAAVGGFSTHTWSDDMLNCGVSGGPCLEVNWHHFAQPADARAGALPKFVTEHGTSETTFHGVSYPAADSAAPYSVTASMPYAARYFEDTLAVLNAGAAVVVFWQAVDEPTEVQLKGKSWGFLDLSGTAKPVYTAMQTLAGALPPGARAVEAPDQSLNELYAGVFVHDEGVVVGIANDTNLAQRGAIELRNAPHALTVLRAEACVLDTPGDPAAEVPDTARILAVDTELATAPDGSYRLDVALPSDSTLTVVLQPAALSLRSSMSR